MLPVAASVLWLFSLSTAVVTAVWEIFFDKYQDIIKINVRSFVMLKMYLILRAIRAVVKAHINRHSSLL